MEPAARQLKVGPAVAGVIAALLVLLVLPNPLRIPQNNPTATAEYAPVPGKQQEAQNSNFGETGLATSPGVGAGEGEGATPSGEIDLPPPEFKPRDKQCVGNPPRQTEDPLSPPCVPFFDGDNGGRTWRGVTKDEIKIALYNQPTWGVEGDMNEPWKPSEDRHYNGQNWDQAYIVRTIKAHVRYFNQRFQTYGRRVHVIATPQQGQGCSGERADARRIIQEIEPFAVVFFSNDGEGECFFHELAKNKIPSFGTNWDTEHWVYERAAPFAWGLYPEQETETALSASFICRKLKGRPARFTHDPLLRGKTRKFGFISPAWQENDARGIARLRFLLRDEIKKQCGMTWDEVRTYNNAQESSQIMAYMKQKEVTTLVCYCYPTPGSELSLFQSAANGIAYYPEWYWDAGNRMFRAIWNQLSVSGSQPPGFGFSHFWRGAAFRQQYHYRAYASVEPDSQPNTRFNYDIYHQFMNLFQGIQAAGPYLTPETIQKGMFTFHYLKRDNPFVPLGGFGPYGPGGMSNLYTFVDTGMAFWWDPTGTPPGGQRGEGCIRVAHEGKRFYVGEWPEGDDDLFVPGAPCSQDNTEIADPKTGGP